MTQPIRTLALKGAIALGLTVGAATMLSAVSVPLTASPGHAFGLGDITDAAKSAVKRVAKDAGNSAKIVGGKAKDAASHVGKGVKENAKDFGGALKRDVSKVGRGVAENAKDFGGALKRDLKPLEPVGRRIANGARTVGGAIKNCTVGIASGDCGHKFTPPEIRDPRVTELERQAGKIIAKRPGISTGMQRQTLRGTGQMKITLPKGQLGNDKSVWGRPVGGVKAPVKGITRKDIQPRQTNRFPNGQQMKITLPKGQLGNDKSVWGRPVGGVKAPVKGITAKDIQPRQTNRFPKGQQMKIALPKEQGRKQPDYVKNYREDGKAKPHKRGNTKRIQRHNPKSKHEFSRNKRRNDRNFRNGNRDNRKAMKRHNNRRDNGRMNKRFNNKKTFRIQRSKNRRG